MNRSTMAIIWKLLVVSLLVGLGLDFFDIRPADLIHDIPDTMVKIYHLVRDMFNWGIKYVLLGAIIVVPVWILMNLTRLKAKFTRKD